MPDSEMYLHQKILYCVAIGMSDDSIAKQLDVTVDLVRKIKEGYIKEGERIKCQANSKNKH